MKACPSSRTAKSKYLAGCCRCWTDWYPKESDFGSCPLPSCAAKPLGVDGGIEGIAMSSKPNRAATPELAWAVVRMCDVDVTASLECQGVFRFLEHLASSWHMLRCRETRAIGVEWRDWFDVGLSHGPEEGGIRAVVEMAVAVAFEPEVRLGFVTVAVGQQAWAARSFEDQNNGFKLPAWVGRACS